MTPPTTLAGSGAAPVAQRADAGRIERWVVAGLLILVMLDIPNYLGEILPSLTPKLTYFAMFGLSAFLLLTSSRLDLGRLRLPMVLFTVAYGAVNLLHALADPGGSASESAHIAWSRIQFLLLVFVLAVVTTAISRRTLARIFLWCAVAISAAVVIDFLLPGLLYPLSTPGIVPGRVGAFFINANKAGEAAVLTALLALPALTRRSALPLALGVGVAVLLTVSRTGMVAWVLLVALYWWEGLLRQAQLLIGGGVVAAMVAGGGLLTLLVDSRDLPSVNAADIVERLSFLATGSLHDESGSERSFLLIEGLRLFGDNLLLGAGVGATHLWEFPVAPHNQPVMMAAEYGVLGLAGWLCLMGLVVTGNYFSTRSGQLAVAGFVALFSMSTHNMLDFPYWIVALLVISMRYGTTPLAPSALPPSGGGGRRQRPG